MSEPNKYLPWTETHKVIEIKAQSRTERIIISPDELMKLNQFLNSKHNSDIAKRSMIHKISRLCVICNGIPDFKIITYPYEGVTLIERYRASCLDKQKER